MTDEEFDSESDEERNLIGDDDSSADEGEFQAFNSRETANNNDDDDDDDTPLEMKTLQNDASEIVFASSSSSKRKRKRVRKEMPNVDSLEKAKQAREERIETVQQPSNVITDFPDSDEEDQEEDQPVVVREVQKVRLNKKVKLTPEQSAALDFAKAGLFGNAKRIPYSQSRRRRWKQAKVLS